MPVSLTQIAAQERTDDLRRHADQARLTVRPRTRRWRIVLPSVAPAPEDSRPLRTALRTKESP
jgi:hypothetical protein